MPEKAIKASIESRKSKIRDSGHSKRKDVIHKAIFRAMKRYYSGEFQRFIGSQKIHKNEFVDLTKQFTYSILNDSVLGGQRLWDLPEKTCSNEMVSQTGLMSVMLTLISHKLAKNWGYPRTFNQHFVGALYKYSEYFLMKLFANKNFWVMIKHFCGKSLFDEAMASTPTIQENIAAYEEARIELLSLAEA